MTDQTLQEALNSLTGYDEIAIAQAFGKDISTLLETPTTAGRALIFVLNRREGRPDKEAKAAAMELPLGDVNAYFSSDDPDPDQPNTPAGEDDSPPA